MIDINQNSELKSLPIDSKIFVSEVDYPDDYRFGVWLAVCDDMTLLDKGYRAYHDHILNSYAVWKNAGYKFLTPTGSSLNLEDLTRDDLYGFLGKSFLTRKGPARYISPQKLAVIDVFFKIKYPNIFLSFNHKTKIQALSFAIRSFYSKPDKNFSLNEIKNIFEIIDGSYIWIGNASTDTSYRVIDDLDLACYLEIYIIRNINLSSHVVVHKIFLPFSREQYLKDKRKPTYHVNVAGSELEQYMPILIFSGIGIPTIDPRFESKFALNCLLKERSTWAYHMTTISIGEQLKTLEIDIDDTPYTIQNYVNNTHLYESIFGRKHGRYWKLGRKSRLYSIEDTYTDFLIENIENFYYKLGTEA